MNIFMLIAVLAIIAVFILVLIVRALLFVPVKREEVQTQAVTVDEKKACENLRDMIRCRTVLDGERYSEFEKFRRLLTERYPNIASSCERKRFDKTAVLYRWRGESAENPTVLMSHYDVVPAQQELWSRDAFAAELVDGVIYGRGTLDTKATLCSIMEAADRLISEGFVPKNDIYLAFSGDEEIAGDGQPCVVEYFKQNSIKPALVLDEGGAVMSGVFPGVVGKSTLIGISEKGQLNVNLTVESKGGHASSPPRRTPVTDLAAAVISLQKHPFKLRFNPATRAMFDTLGRHSSFGYRIIFANLWLFSPVLDLFGRMSGGSLNALLRTSCAFTVMRGSDANNVIPPKASITANLRIINGETVESAIEHLKKHVSRYDVKIDLIAGEDPCKISSIDNEAWDRVCETITDCWPKSIIAPYLMYAASDSRHYAKISDNVYRFSVLEMTKEQLNTIHGNDEHITLEQLTRMVEFYIRLIKKC